MYHKWRSYDLWFLRYGAPQTDFFVILDYFLPLDPPNNPMRKKWKKIENFFEKWKKAWRYHHFTQVYQKSWSYAILFLRYMVCDGCNCYFSFWAIFCPFTTLTAPKIKIKKKKNHLEISWSYAILFLRYMVCDGCSCYFSFWAIFLPFYKNSPKNQNFKKKKKKTHTHRHTHNTKQTKNTWRFDLTHVYQKLWLDEAWFLRYGARQTDRQTDRKSGI